MSSGDVICLALIVAVTLIMIFGGKRYNRNGDSK